MCYATQDHHSLGGMVGCIQCRLLVYQFVVYILILSCLQAASYAIFGFKRSPNQGNWINHDITTPLLKGMVVARRSILVTLSAKSHNICITMIVDKYQICHVHTHMYVRTHKHPCWLVWRTQCLRYSLMHKLEPVATQVEATYIGAYTTKHRWSRCSGYSLCYVCVYVCTSYMTTEGIPRHPPCHALFWFKRGVAGHQTKATHSTVSSPHYLPQGTVVLATLATTRHRCASHTSYHKALLC